MDIQRLIIANPAGNITAIVFDPMPRVRMSEVGATIQSAYPSVEQVLFVEQKDKIVRGQMAGGEFCGNAARALGYVLANGRHGQQTFEMSGTTSLITVDVADKYASLDMHMALTTAPVEFEGVDVPVVHLEGISHGIMLPEHPMYNFLKRTALRPDRWTTVTHVLEDLGIIDKPASGLIFIGRVGQDIGITPYVYVSAIKTLYPEMSCASGSIAAAYIIAGAREDGNFGLTIRQPSQENLLVNFREQNGKTSITVAGSMSVIWDGPAADLDYSADVLFGRHGGSENPAKTEERKIA